MQAVPGVTAPTVVVVELELLAVEEGAAELEVLLLAGRGITDTVVGTTAGDEVGVGATVATGATVWTDEEEVGVALCATEVAEAVVVGRATKTPPDVEELGFAVDEAATETTAEEATLVTTPVRVAMVAGEHPLAPSYHPVRRLAMSDE